MAARSAAVPSRRMRRPLRFGAVALFGALTFTGPTRADELPTLPTQLTVDVDAASVGVTYASRLGQRGVLIGGGGGAGLSPILGTTFATGSHFDAAPNVLLLEVVNVQFFARFEPASWLRVDAGARAGIFTHGGENFTGGQFAALFVAPALAWRWLWVGPRVSAGLLSEHSINTARAVTIDYVIARFVRSW